MTRGLWIAATTTATLAMVLACAGDAPPDLTSAKSVQHGALSFEHPANWTHTVDTDVDGTTYHEIEGANDSMIVISDYGEPLPVDPIDYLNAYEDELPKQVEGIMTIRFGSHRPSPRVIDGAERAGFEVGFVGTLIGVDVPHTIQVWTVEGRTTTLSVHVQVPDEDRATEQSGIDHVLDSLRLDGPVPAESSGKGG